MNDGPTLNWNEIKFHEPVAPREWYRLVPEHRMVEAIRVQMTGNVPQDRET